MQKSGQVRWSVRNDLGTVHVVSTGRANGDYSACDCGSEPLSSSECSGGCERSGGCVAEQLEERRREIIDYPWTWLRQVHGSVVLDVGFAGSGAGSVADAAVTKAYEAPIAINTADCAPIVLISSTSVAVVHAGWKGLLAGVVAEAAQQLKAQNATPVATYLGPCIQPQAYEFSEDDLGLAASKFGDRVRSRTSAGEPALDLVALVGAACTQVGWPEPARPPCTSDPVYYSHRTRRDQGRQTTVAWLTQDE